MQVVSSHMNYFPVSDFVQGLFSLAPLYREGVKGLLHRGILRHYSVRSLSSWSERCVIGKSTMSYYCNNHARDCDGIGCRQHLRSLSCRKSLLELERSNFKKEKDWRRLSKLFLLSLQNFSAICSQFCLPVQHSQPLRGKNADEIMGEEKDWQVCWNFQREKTLNSTFDKCHTVIHCHWLEPVWKWGKSGGKVWFFTISVFGNRG